jgi:hypothetical protein
MPLHKTTQHNTTQECRVRTVNVLFVQGQRNPRYFTFPHSLSTLLNQNKEKLKPNRQRDSPD